METERVRSVNVSLWTQVFQVARFDVGGRRSKAVDVAFEMAQLDTVYLTDEPSIEDITERARDPRVRAVLRTDSRFRRGTVYMVTGLKIARGFKLTQSTSTERGGHLGAGGQVTPEVSLGGDLEMSTQIRRTAGFEARGDIIFAYQLLRIRPKGVGESVTFEVDEFQDDAAFLNDDEEERNENNSTGDDDVEIDVASLAELSDTQDRLNVDPDHEQYAWLFPSK